MAVAAVVAMDVLQRGLTAPRYLIAPTIEPSSAWPTTEAQFFACLDDVETEFKEWKSNLPLVLEDLRDVFIDASNKTEDVIDFVNTIVDALSAKIQNEKLFIRKDKRVRKRIIASSEILQDEDWLLRFHDKFTDLITKWHNERVAFYYALLALRADYHPDAQDGPTFNTSKDLDRFLATIKFA